MTTLDLVVSTGIADFERLFGHPVDVGKMRESRVLLVVGGEDAYERPGGDGTSKHISRVDVLTKLSLSLRQNDVAHDTVVVPRVKHEGPKLELAMMEWLDSLI